MRIIFFGTPEFAVPSLTKLFSQLDFEVVAIVTQPDTRRGRGNQLSPAPVKAAALEYQTQIPVWQPDRLKKDPEVLAKLAAAQADLFVVVAYGQILSPAILAMPRLGCINVHGSLLPKYRGAAPMQWAIANGETTTGITTMQMDAGIDTGAMLLTASLGIEPDDQAESLSRKLADLGADLLLETLRSLSQITPIPQDNQLASYAPMIQKSDWELDWSQPAQTLHNRVRGFYPNCYFMLHGQRVKVSQTAVISENSSENFSGDFLGVEPGAIAQLSKNLGFAVQTAQGQLLIKEVQPAGKRSQTGWDFVNGARLAVGEVLI